MPFNIPNFKDTECLGIAICGEANTEDEAILDFLQEMDGQMFRARYATERGEDAYLRVLFGDLGSMRVHIDATKMVLVPDSDRSLDKPIPEVIECIAKLRGASIVGRAYGRYIIPINNLPPAGIVSSTMYEREEDDVILRISDARFEIKGAPIRSLAWSLTDDKKIVIDVEGPTPEDAFGENYLVDQLAVIDTGFRVFVRGEKQHAQAR